LPILKFSFSDFWAENVEQKELDLHGLPLTASQCGFFSHTAKRWNFLQTASQTWGCCKHSKKAFSEPKSARISRFGHATQSLKEMAVFVAIWLVVWNIWMIFPYIGNSNPN